MKRTPIAMPRVIRCGSTQTFLTSTFLPVLDDGYEVMVRKSDDEDFEPMKLQLRPAHGAPGFFQGYYLPPAPGDYEVTAVGSDEEESNVARFSVYEESLEMRRTGMRPDVAEQIAAQSSGEVVSLEEVDSLVEKIERPASLSKGNLHKVMGPCRSLLTSFVGRRMGMVASQEVAFGVK